MFTKTQVIFLLLFSTCYMASVKNSSTHDKSINKTNGDTIIWSSTQLLTWEDFKSPVKTSNLAYGDANASINFIVEPDNTIESHIVLHMYVCFIKSQSWVDKRHLKYNAASGLRHEQYHFNLGEMIMRQFRKDILENAKDNEAFVDFLTERFSYYNSKSSYMQKLYDKETIHSIDSVQQLRWEKAIDDSLKLYEAYANPIVVVK